MRRRLVWYFARKRCLKPDELADDTLNRIARRLEEDAPVTDVQPSHYCYIVAKFVLLDHLRRPEERQGQSVGDDRDAHDLTVSVHTGSDSKTHEGHLECLDRCLRQLAPADRELVLEYYRGEERTKTRNRQALAERLAVTANALSIRACRIRNRLEGCVNGCRTRSKRDMFLHTSSRQD
jgi:DNA-directed RNA polymerase specialized sigma24 family protein